MLEKHPQKKFHSMTFQTNYTYDWKGFLIFGKASRNLTYVPAILKLIKTCPKNEALKSLNNVNIGMSKGNILKHSQISIQTKLRYPKVYHLIFKKNGRLAFAYHPSCLYQLSAAGPVTI